MKSHRHITLRLSALLAIVLYFAGTNQAQDNDILLFGSQHELNASRVLPSAFGKVNADRNFWISIPYIHVNGGQDFMKNRELFEVLDGGEVPSQLITDVVNRMDGRNRIWAAAEVTPLAFGWRIRSKGEELVSMNLSITEQVFAKSSFGSGLFEVAWFGNAPYAGTVKELGPFEGDAVWQREIALGAAFPLADEQNFSLRGGFRAKYNMGMAAAHARPTASTLTTAVDGSEILYDLLVKANVSGMNDLDPMGGNGSGFGMDFGTSASFGRWTADFSLLDLGFLTFKNDVTTFTARGEDEFVGLNLEEAFEGDITFADSLENYVWTEEIEGGEMTVSTSTRIVLRGGYAIPSIDKKGRNYARHSFFLSYIQGFVEGPRSSFEPQVSAAYVFNLNNIFELGTSVGYAHEDIDLGAFLSVRGGPFNFGLASSDFAGLLIGGSKSSADASFQMSFAF